MGWLMSKGWIAYWCALAVATVGTAALVLWSCWNGLMAPVQGAIVSGTFTAVSAIVGVLVVMFQLKRQGENAVMANRATEAMKLKKDVYAEVVAACKDALDDQRSFVAYTMRFQLDVNNCRDSRDNHAPYSPPDARFAELLDRYFACLAKTDALISLQERWEIIEPRSSVFKLAFAEAKFQIDKAHDNYGPLAMKLMPQHGTAGAPLAWQVPEQLEIEELRELGRKVRESFGRLRDWITDFQFEMQNLLLGEMFHHQVFARERQDPRNRTLRLDHYQELHRYFTQETELGKSEAGIRAVLAFPLVEK